MIPKIERMCALNIAKQVLCWISSSVFLGQLAVSYGPQTGLTIDMYKYQLVRDRTSAVHVPPVMKRRVTPDRLTYPSPR
jgi:hypothetical protein